MESGLKAKPSGVLFAYRIRLTTWRSEVSISSMVPARSRGQLITASNRPSGLMAKYGHPPLGPTVAPEPAMNDLPIRRLPERSHATTAPVWSAVKVVVPSGDIAGPRRGRPLALSSVSRTDAEA